MFVALRLISLPEGRLAERNAIVAALGAAAPRLPGVTSCWVAPVSPTAVINAGDILWRMTSATEGEALRAAETAVWRDDIAPLLTGLAPILIGYRITGSTVRRRGPGIWRALIFRTFPGADPALLRQLESATLLLPDHVHEIRSWALNTIAFTDGAKAFTHVWEQEFDRIDDLTGPYMTDPAHWGIADAYFDAEYPEYVVDPHLIQVVGVIDASILPAVGPQPEDIA